MEKEREGGEAPDLATTYMRLHWAPNSLDDALDTEGFSVIENAADAAFCAAVRRDIEGWFKVGLLRESLNRLATARGGDDSSAAEGHVLQKKGD